MNKGNHRDVEERDETHTHTHTHTRLVIGQPVSADDANEENTSHNHTHTYMVADRSDSPRNVSAFFLLLSSSLLGLNRSRSRALLLLLLLLLTPTR